MKNKRLFTGIISLVLVFGLIGCDLDSDSTDPGPEIVSTWTSTYTDSEIGEITETLVLFADGTWSATYSSEDGDEIDTGTYLLEEDNITFTTSGGETSTGTISGNTLTSDGRTYQKQ